MTKNANSLGPDDVKTERYELHRQVLVGHG